MLVRFFVSNFLSFHEEVEFNMLPGNFKVHKNHIYPTTKVDLLKSAAIYGANGSGKSNFVKAIHFLHDVVVKGSIIQNDVKYSPFKLDANNREKESTFGLECFTNNKYYLYSIKIQNNIIFEESLVQTFPNNPNKENLIFTRYIQKGKIKIDLNPKFIKSDKEKYRYEIYAEDLQSDESLINKIQDKLKEVRSVFKWFENNLWILYPESKYLTTLRLCNDDSYKEFLNEIIPRLDTGMIGIDVERIPFSEFFSEDEEEKKSEFIEKLKRRRGLIHFFKKGKEYVAMKIDKTFYVIKVKTFNENLQGEHIAFDPEEQSDGTRRIMDLLPAIKLIMSHEAVFIVDEIDRSIHASLIKELVSYFMESQSKGQLIFTTHESSLLDFDILRADEIWLTEKNENRSTQMYSLSDFKPRYDLDIRRGYFAGRFGGIPHLENFQNLHLAYGGEE